MNTLKILEDAKKVYIFEPVYDISAATEQANKKKLDAFGVMAKFNILNKPKDEAVHAGRSELRYEPFWFIDSNRKIDYKLLLERKLEVDDEYATSILIDGKTYEIFEDSKKSFVSNDKRYSTLNVQYNCNREIKYTNYIDGLGRNIKSENYEKLFKNSNYKFKEVEDLTNLDNIISPKFSFSSAIEEMKNSLLREKIISHEILTDDAIVDKIYLYFRPVYAFEFIWSNENKVGIIEIDGLNGEISEKGVWLKDRVSKVMTRDMFFDIGGEIANGMVPGGGVVVKMIDRMTK
ncbi:hypothetical protein N5U00_09360 [Aliarcobacter butzleri]|uniref:hypothetical protein n=1 Tax=Aliarcobacter butzleri TaxID=28197 RepID=UPI0021B45C63|nr:hypothetical protein [Aliarcobacter butzleri]MCT7553625.1 hypothetical protein [Aliarcobacter butzleri]MCT7557085.1 hypothetical protein [Aliarcobacter butzleri]MCT7575537.1 hypothetical protein [Aliarcobacter butzleri]MCT7579100.1 hypothetical protein [Aliarcobacter butzleri]MCT7613774.1 hypothetical protein [Aliarcobacter butzleri]